MAKKTKKVKKNTVQSVKPVHKKKAGGIVKKRKKRVRVSMDNIYGILNKAQLSRKKTVFAVGNEDVDVVENIVKDVNLKYNLVRMKTQSVFTIEAQEEVDNFDTVNVEYLDDELVEDGQVF